ncbi:MAG TPA: acetyltransferase [Rhodoglobus sp.]|nr:acetyltransferase [Rhodoglobus sp.]
MPVALRAARADDHDALLAVWRGAVEATHDFLTPDDVAFYAEAVARYLPVMSDLRVAADAGDRPVGFLAQDGGEIHMLFVAPQAQGGGIGTALLEDVAREHPVLRVDVNEQNPSGRRFYAARGFEQVGRSETDGEGRPFPLLHLRRG